MADIIEINVDGLEKLADAINSLTKLIPTFGKAAEDASKAAQSVGSSGSAGGGASGAPGDKNKAYKQAYKDSQAVIEAAERRKKLEDEFKLSRIRKEESRHFAADKVWLARQQQKQRDIHTANQSAFWKQKHDQNIAEESLKFKNKNILSTQDKIKRDAWQANQLNMIRTRNANAQAQRDHAKDIQDIHRDENRLQHERRVQLDNTKTKNKIDAEQIKIDAKNLQQDKALGQKNKELQLKRDTLNFRMRQAAMRTGSRAAGAGMNLFSPFLNKLLGHSGMLPSGGGGLFGGGVSGFMGGLGGMAGAAMGDFIKNAMISTDDLEQMQKLSRMADMKALTPEYLQNAYGNITNPKQELANMAMERANPLSRTMAILRSKGLDTSKSTEDQYLQSMNIARKMMQESRGNVDFVHGAMGMGGVFSRESLLGMYKESNADFAQRREDLNRARYEPTREEEQILARTARTKRAASMVTGAGGLKIKADISEKILEPVHKIMESIKDKGLGQTIEDGITDFRLGINKMRYKNVLGKAGKFRNLYEKYQSPGIDADLLQAMVAKESSGNPNARAKPTKDDPHPTAKGLMQIIKGTYSRFGKGDPFNPEENVKAGSEYLKYLKDKFGTTENAVAAYNMGEGNFHAYKEGRKVSAERQKQIQGGLEYKHNVEARYHALTGHGFQNSNTSKNGVKIEIIDRQSSANPLWQITNTIGAIGGAPAFSGALG